MEFTTRFFDKGMTDITPGTAYALKRDNHSLWNEDVIQILVVGVIECLEQPLDTRIHIAVIWKDDSIFMKSFKVRHWKFYQESLVRL